MSRLCVPVQWLGIFLLALSVACAAQTVDGGSSSDDDTDGNEDDSDDDTEQDDDSATDDADDDSDDTGPDDDTYQPPDGFEVAVYDVGQGDAILLRFPGGSTMLVDGGPNESGYDVILPDFDDLNLTYLDYLVTTHPDADHCGGLDDIVDNIDVGVLWENGQTKDTVSWTEFSEAVDDHDIPRVIVHRGDEETVDDCLVRVFNADQGYSDVNANSVVLSVNCEGVTFLLTADATEQLQADLIETYGSDLAANVVKVPHHGSSDRDSDFPNWVLPDYAVISVGQNSYGHPDADVIAEWEAVGAEIYRTDEDGMVILSAVDGSVSVSTGSSD